MNLPYNNTLDVRKFESMLETKNTLNSYKILWLKAIIKKIELNHTLISYNSIVCEMLLDSFDFVSVYHLRYGGTDRIPNIINKYDAKTKNDLYMKILSDPNFDMITKSITGYVPYRLLTSFFESELRRLPDNQKNSRIIYLSKNNIDSLYILNDNEKNILINPIWKSYILDNISIIQAWIDYKLIIFLQRRNPSIPNIPFKVTPIDTRNLTKQTKLWKNAINHNPTLAFDLFLNSPINQYTTKIHGAFSLDHFIPYSFVMHNELWNLVPIHKNLNSTKSNHLPQDKFISSYINLQYDFFVTLRAFGNSKDYEDYLSLTNTTENNLLEWDKEIFSKLMNDSTVSLYKIAYNHGYTIWKGM